MKFLKDLFCLVVGCSVYLLASLFVSVHEALKKFLLGKSFKRYLKMTPEEIRKSNVDLAIKIAKRQKRKGL